MASRCAPGPEPVEVFPRWDAVAGAAWEDSSTGTGGAGFCPGHGCQIGLRGDWSWWAADCCFCIFSADQVRFVVWLMTSGEPSEDSDDFASNHLLQLSQRLSSASVTFAVVYLVCPMVSGRFFWWR